MKKNKVLKELTDIDYRTKLSKEEREYLDRFDQEMYGGNSGRGDAPLMTAAKHIKEDNRTNNQIYKDAFTVCQNTGGLIYDDNAREAVISRAEDELEWEDVYANLGSEKALELIVVQAEKDIAAGKDVRTSIVRMIGKYERLKRNIRQAKKRT